MLERLRNGLLSGPGLNARPQASRQRMDPLELTALGGTSPENLIQSLLTQKELQFPAKIPAGNWPGGGEMSSWEPEEQAAFVAWRKQGKVLRRFMTIAEDAQEYFNDHGETSLALGFPLLSMPKEIGTKRGVSSRSSRWLAPVAFLPISLQVKMGGRAEVIIRLAGEGERLVEPNTALFALLEQMCGRTLDVEFTGDDGSDPWAEISALTKLAAEAAGVAVPATACRMGEMMVSAWMPR